MSDVADQAEAIEAMERELRIADIVRGAALKSASQADARGATGDACEDCDEPIDPRRLAAVPGVRRCVKCEAEREGARRVRSV